MDCTEVRGMLTEHVLGTLDDESRRRFVERHVQWCAGCRKEVAELEEGATAMLSSLPPVDPPPALEDRVVMAVKAEADRHRRMRRPRGGLVAAGVAALMAIGAFGWAMAMTGKVSKLEDAALNAVGRAERYSNLLRDILRDADDGQILSTNLVGVGEAVGGGQGILWDSPGGYDWVLVITGGLRPENGPYRVYLTTGGYRQRVGRLAPSAAGEMAVYRIFSTDVSEARWVSVRDRGGHTVLRGNVVPDRD